jgi:hypothetical protein
MEAILVPEAASVTMRRADFVFGAGAKPTAPAAAAATMHATNHGRRAKDILAERAFP